MTHSISLVTDGHSCFRVIFMGNMTETFFLWRQHLISILTSIWQGIKLTQDSLIDVSQTHGDNHVRQLEAELINLRRQIQTNKQNNSQEKQRSLGPVEKCRPPDVSFKYFFFLFSGAWLFPVCRPNIYLLPPFFTFVNMQKVSLGFDIIWSKWQRTLQIVTQEDVNVNYVS